MTTPPSFEIVLAAHTGRIRTTVQALAPAAAQQVEFSGALWEVSLDEAETAGDIRTLTLTARVVRGRARAVAAGLRWTDAAWTTRNWVLLPGAVYAGNRFPACRRPYQPIPRDIGQRGDRLVLDITDLPRLSAEDGLSHLDQTSLDTAIPGLGIWFPDRQRAWLVLTPRHTPNGPYGFEVEENAARTTAEISLLVPGFLHPRPNDPGAEPAIGDLASAHRHPQNPQPVDLGPGEAMTLRLAVHDFPAPTVQNLFDRVLTHRLALADPVPPPPAVLPFSAAWEMLEEKANRENWHEGFGLYQVGLPWQPDQPTQFWQNGWLGGGLITLALGQDGSAESQARAARNLDFLLDRGVTANGFFRAIMAEDGTWFGDLRLGGREPLVLIRRQGECLLFVLRQIALWRDTGRGVPETWRDAARRVAAALCDLWERAGEFGFLLNSETAKIAIRGSTSGAWIPGALVLAAREFGDPRFRTVALRAAEHFRTHDLAWGVTSGGPGDAVQSPDSESICGLVESFTLLADDTGDPVWSAAAQAAAVQAASWVIAHPCEFPPESALARLGLDARGAVLANAQNKCGVPGLCTLSGLGLLRVFRATGDTRLLDVLRDVAHALPHFVSRADRPIPARIRWGHPRADLAPGWICERVNITPSWNEPLGEQAAYSCWCEVALMLTWADLPGVYAQPDTGLVRTLDHVEADWGDPAHETLRLTNPTAFPATVRLLVEPSDHARRTALPLNPGRFLPRVTIPAGGTRTVYPLPIGTIGTAIR